LLLNGEQEGKQHLSEGCYQRAYGYKESVEEGETGGNILYSGMKVEI
jgi:hypothetical protein